MGAFAATFVYGGPQLHLRSVLWEFIRRTSSTTSLPWVIAGDFNQVCWPHDKISNSVALPGADELIRVIDDCGLIELPVKGQWVTWTNGRVNEDAVW